MPFLRESRDGLILQLQVQPGARRNEIVGLHGDRLKVKVKAPPVDGAANAEIIRFLSETLSLRRHEIEISSGESGRQKNLKIQGSLSAEDVRTRLGAVLKNQG